MIPDIYGQTKCLLEELPHIGEMSAFEGRCKQTSNK